MKVDDELSNVVWRVKKLMFAMTTFRYMMFDFENYQFVSNVYI